MPMISDRDKEWATSIGYKLWHHFNEKEWEAARKLLSDDFEALWPQSREKIVGPDNFISISREYPGNGKIQIINSRYGYDQWDKSHEVTTTVQINWVKPDGTKDELFCISMLEIDREGLINSAVEYWAETYPAPEWRRKYVELY